jgi:hypothetical protein
LSSRVDDNARRGKKGKSRGDMGGAQASQRWRSCQVLFRLEVRVWVGKRGC